MNTSFLSTLKKVGEKETLVYQGSSHYLKDKSTVQKLKALLTKYEEMRPERPLVEP